MNATMTAALSILLLTGAALADIHETKTFAGPYGVLGEDNPRNTTLTANFTGVDAGTPYQPAGIYLMVDLTSNSDFTFANETVIRITPPSGPSFEVIPSDEYFYDVIHDATVDVRFPAGVSPIGQWSFYIYQLYEFDGSVPDAYISNLRVSLQTLPAVEYPDPVTDLGALSGQDLIVQVPNYSGADVFWYKFTTPQAVDASGDFSVDIDTYGSDFAPGGSGAANDTEIGLFDANGTLYATNDDIFDGTEFFPESWLSFGSSTPRNHGENPATFTGRDGQLPAGDYYLAVGAWDMDFDSGFVAAMNSLTPGGPMLQVNIYSNFASGPTSCSPADVGVAGGEPGQDNLLDNNDFIAFINFFFAQDPAADQGIAGGEAGSDSVWDNNDFIAFINHFFEDTASCTG